MAKHTKHPKRTPRVESSPKEGKSVRADTIVDTNRESPVWSLSCIDTEGEWSWRDVTSSVWWDRILLKIKHYEGKTWGEMLASRVCEGIPKTGICSNALRRLQILKLDDIDDIYELRLTGKLRIWGIRKGRVFDVVWYDPEHTVCPTKKKRT